MMTSADKLKKLFEERDIINAVSGEHSHLERHLKPDVSTLNRVLRKQLDPTNNNRRPNEVTCSKFTSRYDMDQAIRECIKKNASRIIDWMETSIPPERLELETILTTEREWGKGFVYNIDTKKIQEMRTNACFMILERDNSDLSFQIITAYPDCDNRKNMIQAYPTGRDLSELLKETFEYKDATDSEKIFMEFQVDQREKDFRRFRIRRDIQKDQEKLNREMERMATSQPQKTQPLPSDKWPEKWNKFKQDPNIAKTPTGRSINNENKQDPQKKESPKQTRQTREQRLSSLTDLLSRINMESEDTDQYQQ